MTTKTLKDLKENVINEIAYEELKAEAVKLVRLWAERPKGVKKYGILVGTNRIFLTQEVIDFVKWQNNITEEDLRE